MKVGKLFVLQEIVLTRHAQLFRCGRRVIHAKRQCQFTAACIMRQAGMVTGLIVFFNVIGDTLSVWLLLLSTNCCNEISSR